MRGDSRGLTPATLLDDSPFEWVAGGTTWRPANYDRQHRGQVSVRQALEESLNVPTVRAAQRIGLDRIVSSARACGIDSPLAAVPALALGAVAVTPLELATAYATLARGGIRVPSSIVREVVDAGGRRLRIDPEEPQRAMSDEAAYLVTDILHGVFERGTARSAAAMGFAHGAAGKTGTTDDTRDAWFVGYDSAVLVLVWIGFDDNEPTGLTGATGALPIWADLMRRAAAPATSASLTAPPGIVVRRIDPQTGGLAVGGCPRSVDESFARGSEPTRPCPQHRSRFKRWLERLFDRADGAPPHA